jgi:hypothetical protein
MIITCWPAGKMLTIDRAATRVTSDAAAFRDARAHDVTFGQSTQQTSYSFPQENSDDVLSDRASDGFVSLTHGFFHTQRTHLSVLLAALFLFVTK